MNFTFTVVVQVERDSGKFASRDEVQGEIQERLVEAASEEITGVGADGDSIYLVSDVSVEAS